MALRNFSDSEQGGWNRTLEVERVGKSSWKIGWDTGNGSDFNKEEIRSEDDMNIIFIN